MNRPLALAAVLALFVAGVAAGALGMHLYHDRRADRPGGPPGFGPRHFARRLHETLSLTPEQQRAIDEILARSREEAHGLRRDLRPRIRDIMDRAAAEIEAVLDPAQREEFRRLRERDRSRAEQFLLGPPGGPGMGRMRGGPMDHRPRRIRPDEGSSSGGEGPADVFPPDPPPPPGDR